MSRKHRLFAVVASCVLGAALFGWYKFTMSEERDRGMRESMAVQCGWAVGTAAVDYAQDHKRYPDAGRWEQELAPYLKGDVCEYPDPLHPPAPPGGTPRRFSLNPALAGRPVNSAAGGRRAWLFYESVSRTPSASDDLDACPDPKRDGEAFCVVVNTQGECAIANPEWRQDARAHPPGMM